MFWKSGNYIFWSVTAINTSSVKDGDLRHLKYHGEAPMMEISVCMYVLFIFRR